LWKGWPIKPKPGDWSLFRDHLFFNVCSGDPELFHYFMSWWAHKFQYPEKKIGTAIVLKGGEGMGKTTVAVFFHKLIGPYFKTVSSARYVTGNFNGHMANALILHSEEAFWAGNHADQSKINDIITGHTHQIEFKGREPRQMPSFMDMLIMGNPDWLIPAGHEARRFAVCTMTKPMSRAQFLAMQRQMEGGGYEGLMNDLVEWDVASVNLQAIPKTEGLLLQKEMSLEPHVKMLLEIAREGVIPGTSGEGEDEVRSVQTNVFYKWYTDQIRPMGFRAIDSNYFGRILKNFGIEKVRSRVGDGPRGTRANFYFFPLLPWFRATFERYLQQEMQWDPKVQKWEPEFDPD
jgi:hypothetical protein